jgi:hypothetical protein
MSAVAGPALHLASLGGRMRLPVLAAAAAALTACSSACTQSALDQHKDSHGLETPVVSGGVLPFNGPNGALNSAASLPPGFEDGSSEAIQSRIAQNAANCGTAP